MKVSLSDSEWRVMKLLWEEAPRTIAQLTAALRADTGWTKYTVITFLGRMEQKGAVRCEEGGRAKQFYPLIDRDEAVHRASAAFLRRVCDGSLGTMVNTMVSRQALSREEIGELLAILQKAEEDAT